MPFLTWHFPQWDSSGCAKVGGDSLAWRIEQARAASCGHWVFDFADIPGPGVPEPRSRCRRKSVVWSNPKVLQSAGVALVEGCLFELNGSLGVGLG